MVKKNKEVCQIPCFNKNKVNRIQKSILPQEDLNSLIELFKTISDNTRTKILLSLKDAELCVCDICNVLGMSLSAVSHQLRLLRNLKLVKYRSQGKMAFYSLTNKYIINLIQEGIRHIR